MGGSRALAPLVAVAVLAGACTGGEPGALPTSAPASPSAPDRTPDAPTRPATTPPSSSTPTATPAPSPEALGPGPAAPTVSSVARELAVVLQQQVLLVSATAGAVGDGDAAAAEGWAAELAGRNAEALATLTASIYPDDETQAVSGLVREAAPPLLEYARATAPGGDPAMATAAKERLDALVVEAGAVLERVTGLSSDDGEEQVGDHLDALLTLVDARLAGDESAAYRLQRRTVAGVDTLVATVAETIGVQQGYAQMGGAVLDVSGPASAAGVRAAVPLLLAERAGLVAQATDAAVRGDAAELAAARSALGAGEGGNGRELAAVIEAVHGPAVAEEFGAVVGAHTDLLLQLGQASAPDPTPTSPDTAAAEVVTSGETLAAVLAELTDDALPVEDARTLVSEQLAAQTASVSARAAGDAAGAASAAGVAAARAAELGSRFAEGLVAAGDLA